jgi:hypothetical protein
MLSETIVNGEHLNLKSHLGGHLKEFLHNHTQCVSCAPDPCGVSIKEHPTHEIESHTTFLSRGPRRALLDRDTRFSTRTRE